ncbi:ABC transporter permease [Vulgatibacter sp.]|uniref:ABC transporter permease n=1 Tax=Vulgatibacter sp. TaxID=1971226 RepID=UPI00356842A7
MIPVFYSWRSLLARRLSTAATVIGLGLVVFVFAAVLMLSNGIESALEAGGDPDNLVLLREGADNEIASGVERDALRVIASWPEVATSTGGQSLAAGETVVIVALPRGDDRFTNATARGIDGASLALRPAVRIVEGRAPRPGSYEVAIGTGIVGRSPGAFVGGELRFANQRWPVVGVIAAEGSALESEIWAWGDALRSAFQRQGFSSIVVRAPSIEQRDQLALRVEGDVRFTLEATPEDDYWAEQAQGMATFIRVLGLFVSLVFGVGAILGAMITMYAQVAARVRELAMMRAVGFRRTSVLGSVVVESALLGAAGGILGAVGAFFMRWVEIRTVNFDTFSEVSFGFAPTAGILFAAVAFGIGMGLIGGLLPALKAARISVLDGLRA